MLHKFNARIGSHAGGAIVGCGAVGAAMRATRLLAHRLSPLSILPLASALHTTKSLTATLMRIGYARVQGKWNLLSFIRCMRTLISLLLLLPIVSACASGPSKAELDDEVKRLCAIDGGVKVYEVVRLPPDKFNQYGQINFYKPTQGENALGLGYVFKQETHYYKRGNPEMSRRLYQIFRRPDNKLLGEVVIYGRGGGDLPGPWYGSSFDCPDLAEGEISLFRAVFIQSNRRE